MELLPPSEAHGLHALPTGLLIQARDEEILSGPVSILQDAYGELLHLTPPRPRLLFLDGYWCEPVMVLRVRVRRKFAEAVLQDLRRREALFLEQEAQFDAVVLRVQAPMSRLLGYGQDLAALSESSGMHWIWLDNYCPMASPPKNLAA